MERIIAGFGKLVRENRQLYRENKKLIANNNRMNATDEQLIRTNNELAEVLVEEFAHLQSVVKRCEGLEREKTRSLRRLGRRAERRLERRPGLRDWFGGWASAVFLKRAF